MRTTVTLDPDVAAKLKQVAHEHGASFEEALNTSVRLGLRSAETPQPYRVPTRRLGIRPEIDLDWALGMAGEMEDAETLRRPKARPKGR